MDEDYDAEARGWKLGDWPRADERTVSWIQTTSIIRSEADWLAYFKKPTLKPAVPGDLRSLIGVARGAMVHSLFFYPLATLGAEQCLRVLETGLRLRCQQIGFKGGTFKESIDRLIRAGLIVAAEEEDWNAARQLRNSSSHPERQAIFDPGQAFRALEITVCRLNELFG